MSQIDLRSDLVQLSNSTMPSAKSEIVLKFSEFPQPQMRKLVRKHQIDKHKRLLLAVSLPEGDAHAFDATLVLTSDREIPISIELVRQGEHWIIDALSFPRSSKQG
jgi:hypothetical protein